MTDFRDRYKRAGFGREDMSTNRALRSIRRDEARREMRDEQFSFLRRDLETAQNDSLDVPENHQEHHEEHEEREEREEEDDDRHEDPKSKATTELEIAVQKRLLQLEKWREERNRKRLAEKKKAKPVFKVGVVHHKIYSPPINKEPVPPPPSKLCKTKEVHPEPPPKRVTRATEKRLAVKAVTNQQKRENLRSKKRDKVESTTNDDGSRKEPFAPKDYMFRPPIGVTPLPLFGRQALEATRINDTHIESDSKITSTSSELPTTLSTGSDSVFTDRDNSTSKSSSRRSRIHRSNHSRDISTTKDNANDSTAESITLKLSTDDLEVLNDQDYLTFNGKIDTSFSKYKKSSPKGRRVARIFTPPVTGTISGKEKDSTPKDGRMAEKNVTVSTKDKNVSFLKQNKSRRSSKISTPPVEPCSTVESKVDTVEDQEMMEVQVNTSITEKVTRQDAIQSPASKRRSSKMFTLKHSSDNPERAITNDEEIMDTRNDAEVNPSKNDSVSMDSTFSKRNKTKSPGNRRRSSKMFIDEMVNSKKTSDSIVPTQEDGETLDEQENNKSSSCINSMDSSVPKQNTMQSPATRRSSKMFPLEAEIPKQSKEVSFKKQQVLDDQEDVHSDSKTSIAKKNTRKSLGRRRSTKLSLQSSVEEPSPAKSISFKEPITTDVETQDADVNINNNSALDTSISKQDKTKSPANQRRSARTSLNESSLEKTVPAKESSFTLKDQNLLENQENLNSNSPDLMGSFIAPLGPRKSTKMINLLEQSITGYSPRRSLRPPPRRTEVPVDQSLIKFSPPRTEQLNESSSSEPTKCKSPNKSDDNLQNFSLNMSLDKDSTPTEKPPAFFSPYIVASRGKSSMRKEVQKRRFSQPAMAEIPTKDTIMQTLNISVEEEERTSQYYKYILDKEIERLIEICDKWDLIKNDATTPEDIHYEIQAAVGQTHLLINKKFERFRRLVLDCETGKGEMLVTCKDLQGFWEMMYMEIKNCDSRFARLEEKRVRGWPADEEDQLMKQSKKKLPVKKAGPKKKPAAVAAKSSSLRALIMAARKKKTEAQEEPTVDVEMIEASIPENSDRISDETATTKPPTPKTETSDKLSRRISTPKSTNKWESLLKKVQMSQARKSTTSPLIVMKLSQMCKTPEVELDDSIVYINSGRTPAKSILKSANDSIMNKSTNKVFFNEQPPEVQEFEHVEGGNNDDDMSIDNSEEPKRRLDFENESFNLTHADEDRETVKTSKETTPEPAASNSPKIFTVPTIVVEGSPLSMSPLTLDDIKPESAVKKGTRRTKKQISFKDSAVDGESHARPLKSTKFVAPLTPRPKSRGNSAADYEEEVLMEVDEVQEEMDDTSFTVPEPDVQKELYLNSNGIITERIVPVAKATPRTARLKRSCSDRSTKSNVTVIENVAIQTPPRARLTRRNTLTPGSLLNSPKTSDMLGDVSLEFATPRTRGRKSLKTPGSMLNNPNTSDILGDVSLESATPKTRGRKSLKRSMMDSTLVEDDANVTVDDATTPKFRRTPKKARKSTKKLNVTKKDTELSESIEGPATPKLRRKSSKLDTIKSDLEGKSTPSLRRKSSKKLQENIEPNEQKTDQEMNESTKVSRTPSLRGKKKNPENVESTEQTVLSKVSEAMTPNTRRKSSRRAHVSTKNEG